MNLSNSVIFLYCDVYFDFHNSIYHYSNGLKSNKKLQNKFLKYIMD